MPSIKHMKTSPQSSSGASPSSPSDSNDPLEAAILEALRSMLPALARVIAERLRAQGWNRSDQPVEVTPPATRRFLPSREALFAAGVIGPKNVRDLLARVSLEDLRQLIGDLGFDPTRRRRKWKDRDRLLDFLAEETTRRAQRNRIFLTEHTKPGSEGVRHRADATPGETAEQSEREEPRSPHDKSR